MLDQVFIYARVRARFRDGPLGAQVDGFLAAQRRRGYERSTLKNQARLVAQLSGWMLRRRLRARGLNELRVEEFIRHRKGKGHRRSDATVLHALLDHLRDAGVAAEAEAESPTPQEMLERAYDEHLLHERRAAPGTRANYLRVARWFLAETDVSALATLTADDITGFVFRHANRYPRSAQIVTTGLRSFLRYLHLRGVLQADLPAAVPSVASRRFERLPAFLGAADIRRLLTSAAPRCGGSHRDLAILLLLVRLGLRAGEVAGLTLDDVVWGRGEITVRGKSGIHTLPVPRDVGESLARYLRHERPSCETRRVFVRSLAPHVGFASSLSVSCVVDRALRRAGLQPLHRGAHLLRHTAATQMLRRGATLSEIGEVLGHRHSTTTALYAHVDVTALRTVALPWPHRGHR